jgi:hypothetical protein
MHAALKVLLALLIISVCLTAVAALIMVSYNYAVPRLWVITHPDFDIETAVDIDYATSLVFTLLLGLVFVPSSLAFTLNFGINEIVNSVSESADEEDK